MTDSQYVDNGTLLLAAAILFVLTLLAGTIPLHLIEFISKHCGNKSKHSDGKTRSSITVDTKSSTTKLKTIFAKDRIVQFLAQLGAGVLIYTAFIHMLPEIRENYAEYLKEKQNHTKDNENHVVGHGGENESEAESLPIVDLCACGGFFMIFLIEELTHQFFLKNHHHHHGPSDGHDKKHTDKLHSHEPNEPNRKERKDSQSSLGHRLSMRQYMKTHKNYHAHVDERECSTSSLNDTGITMIACRKTGEDIILAETHPFGQISHQQNYESCSSTDMIIDSNGIVSKCDVENISNFESIIDEDKTLIARILDALLMILAFSCHAIFDGISIGVQTGSRVWTVLIALLSHKLLIAFILSIQIYERCFQTTKGGEGVQKKPIKRAKLILWFFSTIFAAMSPIGVMIVFAMDRSIDTQNEKQLFIIILAAISAGTIIYIVFLEIIDKSHSRAHISGLVQWIALIIGFGLMHLLAILFH